MKSQERLAAEKILGDQWLRQVYRMANDSLRDSTTVGPRGRVRGIILKPPTHDDYERAAETIALLSKPPETTLAVAENSHTESVTETVQTAQEAPHA